MDGGSGNDLISDYPLDALPAQLPDTTDADFITGGSGSDTLVGSGGADSISGDDGDDSIIGLGGDDLLSGGDGNDTISGGDGDDTISGGFNNDSLMGDAGADVFLNADSESDTVDGGDGLNLAQEEFPGIDTFINVDQFYDFLDSTPGEDPPLDTGNPPAVPAASADPSVAPVVAAGAPFATLSGGILTVNGTPDADVVLMSVSRGGTLTVTLNGDALSFRAADIVKISIAAGDGNDRVSLAGVFKPATISGDAGNDTLTGGELDDYILGGDGNDQLFGGAGADLLDGGAGADIISGGVGDDKADYRGRRRALVVSLDGKANDGQIGEGDNVDTEGILGGRGDDLLIGDAKNNYLSGGLGSDTLIGNGGDDRFSAAPSGETGVDSLSGGDGNDFFQMQDRVKDIYSVGAGTRNQVEQDPGVDVAVP
jgi:Ca2+-binding RTX toxin-like protein